MLCTAAIGFNVESVTYKNIKFQVWDLGGQTSIRPYWRCYYPNTQAIIYVVDSSDTERVGTSREEFHAILQEEELKDALLLVYANKQASKHAVLYMTWKDNCSCHFKHMLNCLTLSHVTSPFCLMPDALTRMAFACAILRLLLQTATPQQVLTVHSQITIAGSSWGP